MKKLLMILGLAVGVNGVGFGQTIQVQVGNETANPITLVSQGAGDYTLSNASWSWQGVSIANQLTINASPSYTAYTDFSTDPAIHYAMSANNFTDSPQTYTMTFTLPLTMALSAGQLVQVSSSISGSLSAGDTNTVTLGLGLNSYIQQAYVGSVAPTNDAGVDLLNSSSTPLTFTPTLTAFSTSFGPFPPTGSPNTTTYTLSANASYINVVTSFSLSANDSASFSGAFVVTPITTAVPEPSQDLLIVGGLGVLLVAVIRRRRTA